MSRLTERIENFNRAYLIFSEAVSAYNKDKSVVVNRWVIWFFQIVGLFGKVSLFRAFEGSEIIKLSVFQNGQNTLLRVRRIVVFFWIVHCFYLLSLSFKPFSPVGQIVWLFGICPFWVFWILFQKSI